MSIKEEWRNLEQKLKEANRDLDRFRVWVASPEGIEFWIQVSDKLLDACVHAASHSRKTIRIWDYKGVFKG